MGGNIVIIKTSSFHAQQIKRDIPEIAAQMAPNSP
jgi:hypothetical protein